MAGENIVSTLNGLFKESYADQLKNLVPDGVMLYNEVKFIGKDKANGNEFHQPVILGTEHGFSYGGTDGTAFNLEDAVPSTVKDAKLQGYEFLLRSRLSYGAVARSMNKNSFESATKLVVGNMVKSFAKRIECMIFHGQTGLAAIDSTTDISGGIITIPAAQWAPGIWSGAVNMKITAVDDGTVTDQRDYQITAVSLENRQLTVTTLATRGSAPAGASKLYHLGAIAADGTSKEFAGLNKIMTNSGSLFNINAGVYDQWKSVEYSASSAALSFTKIQKALARGHEKGLDVDVLCLVNPRGWSDLLNDAELTRHMDQSYSPNKVERGSKGLVFHSQNGKVEIRSCGMLKESEAMILPVSELMRVGSTDVTFKLPGSNDKFFRELDNSAGYELRAYSDQALFCSEPGRLIKIHSIVNS
jgi:hypothetical protein